MRIVHLARKPIGANSVARNILEHETGALNIGACRIGSESRSYKGSGPWLTKLTNHGPGDTGLGLMAGGSGHLTFQASGRWPGNVILIHKLGCRMSGSKLNEGYKLNRWVDGARPFEAKGGDYKSEETSEFAEETWECVDGCPVKDLDSQSGEKRTTWIDSSHQNNRRGEFLGALQHPGQQGYNDFGGASRFFKQVQGEHEIVRVSGDMVCEACQLPFWKHPQDFRYLDSEGRPFLHVKCDGTRLKL